MSKKKVEMEVVEEQGTEQVQGVTARTQAKRAARNYIYEVKNTAAWEELQLNWSGLTDALETLFPGRGFRRQRPGRGEKAKWQLFAEKLFNEGTMTDLEVFQEFGLGRSEARTALRTHLKRSAPEARIWATHADGVWTVEGQGAEVPTGYIGFVPQEPPKAEAASE